MMPEWIINLPLNLNFNTRLYMCGFGFNILCLKIKDTPWVSSIPSPGAKCGTLKCKCSWTSLVAQWIENLPANDI